MEVIEKIRNDIKAYVKSLDTPDNKVYQENELLILSCFAKAQEIIEENEKMAIINEETIRGRCFKVIKEMIPEIEYNGLTKGSIDFLDFIEILMNVEVEFGSSIDEGITSIEEFKTVKDLVEWLSSKIK